MICYDITWSHNSICSFVSLTLYSMKRFPVVLDVFPSSRMTDIQLPGAFQAMSLPPVKIHSQLLHARLRTPFPLTLTLPPPT